MATGRTGTLLPGRPFHAPIDTIYRAIYGAAMLSLTRHGWREMLVGTVVLGLIAAGLWWVRPPLAWLVLPAVLFLFAFFRDPHRVGPAEQHAVVSPADGGRV